METKQILRKQMAQAKKALSPEEKIQRSSRIFDRLEALPAFQSAKKVLLYWSLPDEVQTPAFVLRWAAQKEIYLPVVQGEDLVIRAFCGTEDLVEGSLSSIPEPSVAAEEISLDQVDLVVVPGVAFDPKGGRMGRGKGFYDRLLSSVQGPGPVKVGVAFDCQVVDAVPRDFRDVAMDYVLWESGQARVNRVCALFGIEYPIVAGGMVWCSGWRLAAAVSAAGGLGLIGAGSMKPELLREHIQKCKAATSKPFGVNVPLMSPYASELMEVILQEHVPVVFTSAGSPKVWTARLHEAGIRVVHVVSSSVFAKKSQDAGVDAVVAEGFEAGGHNGREETTTMVLIPQVRSAIHIPLLAAGGIGNGAGMAAALALGAEGVQVGTRFALTQESSASEAFKQLCLTLKEGDTMLSLKKVSPTRLIRNEFFRQVAEAEDRGAGAEDLKALLGRGRAKLGMFDGDLDEGELEIGQVVSLIKDLPSACEVVRQMILEYNQHVAALFPFNFDHKVDRVRDCIQA